MNNAALLNRSQVIAAIYNPETQELLLIFGTFQQQNAVTVALVSQHNGTTTLYTLSVMITDLMHLALTRFQFRLYISNSILQPPESNGDKKGNDS